jgi:hypothetical protein
MLEEGEDFSPMEEFAMIVLYGLIVSVTLLAALVMAPITIYRRKYVYRKPECP